MEKVENNGLNNLTLYRPENAVQEIVFSIFFNESLKFEQITELADSLINCFEKDCHISKHELVRHEQQFSITQNSQTHAQSQTPCGYSIDIVENATNERWLIQLTNDVRNLFLITFHGRDYTRWTQMLKQIGKFIVPLASNSASINIKALGVNYVDVFYWKSESYPLLNQILNAESDWLPKQLLESTEEINYALSKSKQDSDNEWRRIDFLKFSLTQRPEQTILTLTHHLVTELSSLMFFSENGIESKLSKLFQWIHDQNKAMIRSVLTKEVTDKMKGFDEKPI